MYAVQDLPSNSDVIVTGERAQQSDLVIVDLSEFVAYARQCVQSSFADYAPDSLPVAA